MTRHGTHRTTSAGGDQAPPEWQRPLPRGRVAFDAARCSQAAPTAPDGAPLEHAAPHAA